MKQAAFLMDLLGHDILNNNQAILSYLELVLSNRDLDTRTRVYAEKAVPHVKTSSALVENAMSLAFVRSSDPRSTEKVDLLRAVDHAVRELPMFFPSRNIRARVVPGPQSAYVNAHAYVRDLVLKVFLDLVKADPGENIDLEVEIDGSEHKGKPCWSLALTDRNTVLQPGMRPEDRPILYSPDSSSMARTSWYVFAKLAAEMLGGEFDAFEVGEGTGSGWKFVLKFEKAGEP